MRIIATSRKASAHKKPFRRKGRLFIVVLIVSMAGFIGLYLTRDDQGVSDVASSPRVDNSTTIDPKEMTEQKVFSPSEFQALYGSFAYPFTVQIEAPPQITGDAEADKRIQELANARGYRLRSVPQANQLVEISPGLFAQKLTAEPFKKFFEAMSTNSLPIKITSTYRSVNDQLELFLVRLGEYGVDVSSTGSIAAGVYDEDIVRLLETTAPPGYSRHHTGYTVDFQCGSAGLKEFESSPCYSFMSANNYKFMKDLGFIPSYPKGAVLQGPEPESWEYIWVGVEALY